MKIQDRFREREKTEELKTVTVSRDGEKADGDICCLCEHELIITVNETEAVRLVCTAGDLANLVVGRLISEGFAESADEIESIYICDTGNRARVFLKDEAGTIPGRGDDITEIQTCCTDNRNLVTVTKPLKKINGTGTAGSCDIFRLSDSFASDRELHRGTGGTHCAYLMHAGETVYGCEDIGRHNALDKAIGEMVIKGYKPSECLIFTTGRVPVDMVRKAVRAGIGGLISKSVPTVQAIKLAKSFGLSLYFRAWPDSYSMLADSSNVPKA